MRFAQACEALLARLPPESLPQIKSLVAKAVARIIQSLNLRKPSQELVDFLKKKNLEKYAVRMANHENNNYGHVSMLMELKGEELMELAEDCGFPREDRKKLRELVEEENKKIVATPSLGWNLFKESVPSKDSLNLEYLQFEETPKQDYMYSFTENVKPKEHKCRLRVMKAQIERTYLDEDVANEMVILVVGQTGAGKSTHIDGMLNYILGIKWEEPVRCKVVNELQTATKESLEVGSAASQTDAVTAYKIPALKGSPVKSNLTIIDTPGFGDTRGFNFDQKLVDQLKRFFNGLSDHVNI